MTKKEQKIIQDLLDKFTDEIHEKLNEGKTCDKDADPNNLCEWFGGGGISFGKNKYTITLTGYKEK